MLAQGNPDGNGKVTSKDRQLKIALNGPQKASVREEIRAASCTFPITEGG